MKKLVLVILAAQMLVGCMPSFMVKNSITFTAGSSTFDAAVVFKNTWPKCANFEIDAHQKYNTLWHHCKLPEGHVPSEIVIEYAPWLTYGQQVEAGMGNSRSHFKLDDLPWDKKPPMDVLIAYDDKIDLMKEAAIDKLPASSWKRIVLHPADLVFKYRFKKPSGRGNRLRGKELHYIITLNPDGSYKVEDKLYWVSPYSKYGQ